MINKLKATLTVHKIMMVFVAILLLVVMIGGVVGYGIGKVEGERNAVMLQRNHNEEIKRMQANHSFIVTHLTKELTEAVAND